MGLISALEKRVVRYLYWPVCRAYAKHILRDKKADTIFRYICRLQFYRVYHFWPNFQHPLLFSEKLWNRMLLDRNQIFTLVSDKLGVRDFVTRKVGSGNLIPLLWNGENPESIPFEELPLQFVIKTNHGCRYNIIVKDKLKIDRKKVINILHIWLAENYCQDMNLGTEWGYRNIKPKIMIEPLLLGINGKPPVDYKFYCFSGKVEIVTLHFDRFEEHKVNVFDRNFNLLKYKASSHYAIFNGGFKRPTNFDEMVETAEALSTEFDFIRVDLYNIENKIYFGELTPYPGGIFSIAVLDIESQDIVLGKKWQIDRNSRKH